MPVITGVDTAAYRLPTERPESDGTLTWDATTVVLARVHAGDATGLGYTYAHQAAAVLVDGVLAPVVSGREAFDVGARWADMSAALRNVGRRGLGFYALSAVDVALWDLKATLLDVPLVTLLGARRDTVPVYGSGGFTSSPLPALREQLGAWAADGMPAVKMKVGRDPGADPARVTAAREAIGDDVALYVDANGAYTRKQALERSRAFAADGVGWHEEPVSSEDLAGLRLVRDRAPDGMDIAAGEYATTRAEFRDLVEAGAVDCLQADVTRCGGVTGFLEAAALADAHGLDVSTHTAPHVSAVAAAAAPAVRHVEWFHDHVRLEALLFDGAVRARDGAVRPQRERPGLGIDLREADAAPYAV